MLRHLDLFSGIGGFALAARMVGGYETVGFCEIDPYCQAVLRKHWPDVPIYDDVRTISERDVRACDVLTAGFPCQDISNAGKRAGIDGERSGLWSEVARLILELRPRFALLENVSALLGRGMGRVLGDLAEIGYDAEWDCVPAAAVGALHYRDRVWITAYPNTNDLRLQRVGPSPSRAWGEQQFKRLVQDQIQLSVPAGRMRALSDGVPGRMGQLKGYGNAIVPQVAGVFLQAIKCAWRQSQG
jgi:DNA (cytosine-5)-methyltransferase 1